MILKRHEQEAARLMAEARRHQVLASSYGDGGPQCMHHLQRAYELKARAGHAMRAPEREIRRRTFFIREG